MPATRTEFWEKKIARNKERDKEVNRHYKKEGWQVIRVWEHELKSKKFKNKVYTIIQLMENFK